MTDLENPVKPPPVRWRNGLEPVSPAALLVVWFLGVAMVLYIITSMVLTLTSHEIPIFLSILATNCVTALIGLLANPYRR